MIDPTIALQYRPPQIADPTETLARGMQLRAMGQEQQLRNLEVQQRQMDLNDQQVMRQAYMDSGGNMDKFTTLLMQRGASPKAIVGVQQQMLNMQEAHAKLTQTELENAQKKSVAIGSAAQSLLDLPSDEARAAQWPVARLEMIAQGHARPEEIPADYPGEEQVRLYRNMAVTAKDQQDLAFKARETAAAETTAGARALTAQTAASKTAAELPGIQRQNLSAQLATASTPQQYTDLLNQAPHGIAQAFPAASEVFDQAGKPMPAALVKVRQVGMTPEQQTTSMQAAQNAAETARHNLSQESTARLNASVNAGRLAQEKLINGMKYGPGTTEYWVDQLKSNPDSVKEMPPELRSVVGAKFKASTGLPLPTPISGQTQQSETAARNALDGIDFIKQALQNPEIRKNIGPIMGRLGNVEQAIGGAPNMSPQAESLAQELRTRMRYFVFQEGKAVLGGRLPQNLMSELESSSANVKMDAGTLEGALNGAAGNAQTVMDNADRQRFGGQMRPREMRSAGPSATPAAAAAAGSIRVKRLSDGATGTIDAKDFDPKKYTRM